MEKEIKIVLDGVFFQEGVTGIGRIWTSLLQVWVANNFARHLVVLNRASTMPQITGIQYRVTDPYLDPRDAEVEYQKLQDICDREQADVFISSYFTTTISTPAVCMIYDMIPEVFGLVHSHPMWRNKHTCIEKAAAHIAISAHSAKDIVKFFPQIQLEDIAIAYCGVSNEFTPASHETINYFKFKYGITKPYFLTVGLKHSYKNADLFLKAFAKLPTKQGFDIVCVDNTNANIGMQSKFRQYTMGSTVHSLKLSDEELRVAYAGAVALIFPSKYEGFGLPLLEALACGCPVITCPNASIPEVVGEAGLYVDDEDVDRFTELLCEVQKPQVRQALVSAGLQQAQKFSWQNMADQVSSVLVGATLQHLELNEINLIMFPDWERSPELLFTELAEAIAKVLAHPQSQNITLLVYTSSDDLEVADSILSEVVMYLLLQPEIEIEHEPQISLLENLTPLQWQYLIPQLNAHIQLEYEDITVISSALINLKRVRPNQDLSL